MARSVVDLIVEDHRELRRLFKKLRAGEGDRQMLFQLATVMLEAHSRAEEAEVYPQIAEVAGVDDAAQARDEHAEADQLVNQMKKLDPQSRRFEQLMHKLIEAVEQHIEEEESTTLPALRSGLSSQRLAQLADAFAARRGAELADGPSPRQFGDAVMSRERLYEKARANGIPGRSQMTKQELQDALVKAEA